MTGPPEAPEPSPVGSLCQGLPTWATLPPVEAVAFAWGASEDHQLGLDSEADVTAPKVVESLLGIQFRGRTFGASPLVGGSRNTLAIDAEGGLWSWGWNDRGTLGQGHRAVERKPRRVQALKGIRIVQVALGGWHCLALSDAGQVYAWGGTEYNQCAVADQFPHARDVLQPVVAMPHLRVKQVAAGGMNSVALTVTGEVWTWGEPWGDFALNTSRAPQKVEGARDIAAIACGAFHTMALDRAGQVFTWGTNDYGQLGNGTTCYSTTPVKVVDLDQVPIADITAGGWHSVALSAAGQMYVWGRGEYGRLGINDRTGSSKLRPTKVPCLDSHRIVQAAAGGTHTLCLTATGRMFIWGRGSYGRLGLRKLQDCYSPVECILPGGHERWRIAAITAGGRHSLCLAVPLREGPLGIPGEEVEVEDEGGAAAAAAADARGAGAWRGGSPAGAGAPPGPHPGSPEGGSVHGSLYGTDDLVAAGIVVNAPAPAPAPERLGSNSGGGLAPPPAPPSRPASSGAALPSSPRRVPSGGAGSAHAPSPPTINIGGVSIPSAALASPRRSVSSPLRSGSSGFADASFSGGASAAIAILADVAGLRASPRPSSPLQGRPGSMRLGSGAMLGDEEDDDAQDRLDPAVAEQVAQAESLHKAAEELERMEEATEELEGGRPGDGMPRSSSMGASPAGGASRGGSPGGSSGPGSPPGSAYDVSMSEVMQRLTNGLPERTSIHYNTHLT